MGRGFEFHSHHANTANVPPLTVFLLFSTSLFVRSRAYNHDFSGLSADQHKNLDMRKVLVQSQHSCEQGAEETECAARPILLLGPGSLLGPLFQLLPYELGWNLRLSSGITVEVTEDHASWGSSKNFCRLGGQRHPYVHQPFDTVCMSELYPIQSTPAPDPL